MKKLLTLLAALVVAVSLSMPAFAQEAPAGEAASQAAPAKKETKKKKKTAKMKAEKKSSKKKKKEATEPAPGQ